MAQVYLPVYLMQIVQQIHPDFDGECTIPAMVPHGFFGDHPAKRRLSGFFYAIPGACCLMMSLFDPAVLWPALLAGTIAIFSALDVLLCFSHALAWPWRGSAAVAFLSVLWLPLPMALLALVACRCGWQLLVWRIDGRRVSLASFPAFDAMALVAALARVLAPTPTIS